MTLHAKQQNFSSKAVEKNFLATKRLKKKKTENAIATESDRKRQKGHKLWFEII